MMVALALALRLGLLVLVLVLLLVLLLLPALLCSAHGVALRVACGVGQGLLAESTGLLEALQDDVASKMGSSCSQQ